jgi:hypothetical protein
VVYMVVFFDVTVSVAVDLVAGRTVKFGVAQGSITKSVLCPKCCTLD